MVQRTANARLAAVIIATCLALPSALPAAPGALKEMARPTTPSQHWAAEVLSFFSRHGIRAEVPHGPGGRPLSRYDFALLTRELMARAFGDLIEADARLAANPGLTLRDVDPPHLQGDAQLVRWFVDGLWDPDSLKAPRKRNYIDRPLPPTQHDPFVDIPREHPAYEAVQVQAHMGLSPVT
jgi:hypothetical protein